MKRSGYALMAAAYLLGLATFGLAVVIAGTSPLLTAMTFVIGALLVASCVQLARAGVWPVIAVIAAVLVGVDTLVQLAVSALVAARGPIVTADLVASVATLAFGPGLVQQLLLVWLVADSWKRWSLAALVFVQAGSSLALMHSAFTGALLAFDSYLYVSGALHVVVMSAFAVLAVLKFLHASRVSGVS